MASNTVAKTNCGIVFLFLDQFQPNLVKSVLQNNQKVSHIVAKNSLGIHPFISGLIIKIKYQNVLLGAKKEICSEFARSKFGCYNYMLNTFSAALARYQLKKCLGH